MTDEDLKAVRDHSGDAWAREVARELLDLRAQISLEKERASKAEENARQSARAMGHLVAEIDRAMGRHRGTDHLIAEIKNLVARCDEAEANCLTLRDALERAQKGPSDAAHEYLKAMLIGVMQAPMWVGRPPGAERAEELAKAAKLFGEIMSRPSEAPPKSEPWLPQTVETFAKSLKAAIEAIDPSRENPLNGDPTWNKGWRGGADAIKALALKVFDRAGLS